MRQEEKREIRGKNVEKMCENSTRGSRVGNGTGSVYFRLEAVPLLVCAEGQCRLRRPWRGQKP